MKKKFDGCEFRGTLNVLLTTDHLNNCITKYNPSYAQRMTIEKLQNKVSNQQQQIEQQIKILSELKLKLDIKMKENEELASSIATKEEQNHMEISKRNVEIDQLKQQNNALQNQIKQLQQTVASLGRQNQSKASELQVINDKYKELEHKQHEQEMMTKDALNQIEINMTEINKYKQYKSKYDELVLKQLDDEKSMESQSQMIIKHKFDPKCI